jgi:hypothetical protein
VLKHICRCPYAGALTLADVRSWVIIKLIKLYLTC